jgi:DNA-binding CsgD family transcriptional regulator
VFSLDWYFTTRAARVNTVRWQELAKADDLGVENWLRIEVLQIMAFLTGIHGNARDSLACAEAALALARRGDDASALGLAYLTMGFAAEFAGEPERALEMGFEAVPRFREAADLRWLPYGLSNLGDLLIYFGSGDEARPLVEEAISLAAASGDDFGLAVVTGDLARIRRHEGDLASALRLFRETHDLYDQVDGTRGKLGCIAGMASIAFDQGQPEHAARLLGAIDAQMQRAGVKVIAFNLMTRRIKDEVRDRLGERVYEREFDVGRSIPWHDAVADAMALAVDTTGDSEDESPVNPFGLTSRERDVLRQLIEGRSDKEIADALYIGARTVQTHVANLLAKLDVHNRAEAAAVAVRNNLL